MSKSFLLGAALAICIAAPAMADMSKKGSREGRGKVDYYFNEIDINNDGRISRAEHDAFGRRMFEEADRDDNGSISRNEMLAEQDRQKKEYMSSREYRDEKEYGDHRYGRLSPSAVRTDAEDGGWRGMQPAPLTNEENRSIRRPY